MGKFKLFRYLINGGRKLLSKSGKTISRSFKTLRAGGLAAGAGRVLNIALNGWLIYDIASYGWDALWGDDEEAKGQAHDAIVNSLLCKEVSVAITQNFVDTQAISVAFAAKSTKYVDEQIDNDTMKGLAYAACSQYIVEYPFGRLAYTNEDMENIIVSNGDAFLGEATWETEQGAENVAASMQEEFDAMDLENADYTQRRAYDFLAYVIDGCSEVYQDETGDTNFQPADVPVTPAEGQPGV